jgi:hypothetical protein
MAKSAALPTLQLHDYSKIIYSKNILNTKTTTTQNNKLPLKGKG